MRGVPDGDSAATAFVETFRLLVPALSHGWERKQPGVVAFVTGIPEATLNGILVHEVDAAAGDVANLLDEVAESGLPYCLQFRPSGTAHLEELAAQRGMTADDDIPLMVLDDARALDAALSADALVIRELAAEDASLHAVTAASGFEAPLELFRELITPEVLRVPGVHCYLGEVGGQAVTTCVGVTFGVFVGIFNVATPPQHRRHGYGGAVTARAIADGFASGATWSWLQASPSGLAVYERLGFRTVESWHCWTASPAAAEA
jgi:N-acetylglutamate synthase